jgi:hypothetical protein
MGTAMMRNRIRVVEDDGTDQGLDLLGDVARPGGGCASPCAIGKFAAFDDDLTLPLLEACRPG